MDEMGQGDEPGGYDDFSAEPDPGLPGDDLIFLAMLDDEERSRQAGGTTGYSGRDSGCYTDGCCGCVVQVALIAGLIAVVAVVSSLTR